MRPARGVPGRLAHRLRSRLGALARPPGESPRHPGQRPGGPTGQGDTVPEPAGEDDVSGGALAGPVAALAFLYVSGASVVAVALLLPFWPEANLGALWALVGLAILVGLGLFEVRRRGVEPSLEVLAALVAAGTSIVSAAALAAGPQAVLAVGVFYVFPAGYAFYAFPVTWAVAEIAYGAAILAGVLWLLDPPAAAAQWVLVTGASVVAGAVIGGLGQQARRRYEAERHIAEALREVDTLKTGLLRAVRHDLGTPLTAVTGLLQTVRDRMDQLPADTRDQLLDRAVANARRLERMLNDLAEHASLTTGELHLKRRPTDLGDLARRVVAELAVTDHPVTVEAEVVTLAVDPVKLERILQNLVVNAACHTPPGTAITVRITAAGGGALLVVEDTGPGVPDELKESVFTAFVQASDHPDAEGTGLGLAVVRQFARAHGGEVWVEDRPGGGARFSVRLPGSDNGSWDHR